MSSFGFVIRPHVAPAGGAAAAGAAAAGALPSPRWRFAGGASSAAGGAAPSPSAAAGAASASASAAGAASAASAAAARARLPSSTIASAFATAAANAFCGGALCTSCVRTSTSSTSGRVKPFSCSMSFVLWICSMHGEKQQRRPPCLTYGATRGTASHGCGRSKMTASTDDSARPGYAQPSAQTSAWRHVT